MFKQPIRRAARHVGGARRQHPWRSGGQARRSSVSQRPGSDHVHFPGALNSKFTAEMKFIRPWEHATIPTYRSMDAEGAVLDPAAVEGASAEEMLAWYHNMVTVSVMDLIMFEAQRQGRVSFYMVSAGEEGIAVGSAAALTPDDVVFAQYREAGVFRQRGFSLSDFMNQLFANEHDTGKGRNMPVHYGSGPRNHHTISSTLATQIPHAAGAAYALKLQRHLTPATPPPPRVVACYFGEGAASEGDFHAALNLAATRACPVVFICRNNGFAISTPTLEQYRGDGIASRGIGYGIDTLRVDGNDIFAVRAATAKARRMALGEDDGAGPRPVLLEAMSYRVSHHSTSDDSFAYRARADVEDWKRRDNPIVRLRKYLEGKGLWDEDKEQQLRSKTRREVLDAVKSAEEAKKPPIRDMFTDVYEDLTDEAKDHMAELKDILDRYGKEEYDVESYVGGIDSLRP